MSPFDLFSPRARILREVRARFGHQAKAVMRELDRYTGSVAADRDRVHRAILKLTDGSLVNVKCWVESALADYREVLGPAEYPRVFNPELIRRFNAWTHEQDATAETSFADVAEGDPDASPSNPTSAPEPDRAPWPGSPRRDPR